MSPEQPTLPIGCFSPSAQQLNPPFKLPKHPPNQCNPRQMINHQAHSKVGMMVEPRPHLCNVECQVNELHTQYTQSLADCSKFRPISFSYRIFSQARFYGSTVGNAPSRLGRQSGPRRTWTLRVSEPRGSCYDTLATSYWRLSQIAVLAKSRGSPILSEPSDNIALKYKSTGDLLRRTSSKVTTPSSIILCAALSERILPCNHKFVGAESDVPFLMKPSLLNIIVCMRSHYLS